MDFLKACCLELGVALSPKQLDSMGIFLRELLSWNRRMNLTGPLTEDRVIQELIADSVLPAPFLPDHGSTLDVGSGAGFPAIPLKICKPETRFCLLEPRSKRVSFLKHVIRNAQLKKIQVLKTRIEALKSDASFERYDIITSRAVAPLERVVQWCDPCLRTGGLMVAFLGLQAKPIPKNIKFSLDKHQLIIHQFLSYAVPGKDRKRHLLILKKL